MNLTPTTRSGVEFNHMKPSSKLKRPGDLFKHTTLIRFKNEAKEGKLDANGAGTHGMVTAYQLGQLKRPTWYKGK